MHRWLLAIAVSITLLAFGCGSDDESAPDETGGAAGGDGGMSAEEAQAECTMRAQTEATCFTDEILTVCVACFSDCGAACVPAGSCPQSFACP